MIPKDHVQPARLDDNEGVKAIIPDNCLKNKWRKKVILLRFAGFKMYISLTQRYQSDTKGPQSAG